MRFDIITIFPEMLSGAFSGGVVKKAVDKGLVEIDVHDLRDFTQDRHRQVDDRPFGGLEGMVMKPEPIFRAVEDIRRGEEAGVYLLSPQGNPFHSEWAKDLSRRDRIILICGRYEGVDERVRLHLVDFELSIGDYVLTGGELPAMVVIEAVTRLQPDALGDVEATQHDSFSEALLDFPQYTRPADYRGMSVPEILRSGNHQAIAQWRRQQALLATVTKRPDLLEERELSEDEQELLADAMERGVDKTPACD